METWTANTFLYKLVILKIFITLIGSVCWVNNRRIQDGVMGRCHKSLEIGLFSSINGRPDCNSANRKMYIQVLSRSLVYA
jgi:hypothetical protein